MLELCRRRAMCMHCDVVSLQRWWVINWLPRLWTLQHTESSLPRLNTRYPRIPSRHRRCSALSRSPSSRGLPRYSRRSRQLRRSAQPWTHRRISRVFCRAPCVRLTVSGTVRWIRKTESSALRRTDCQALLFQARPCSAREPLDSNPWLDSSRRWARIPLRLPPSKLDSKSLQVRSNSHVLFGWTSWFD